jgi:aminopeptidase N
MPAAEITRSETSARAQLLGDCAYDVALDLTGGAETFVSTSEISFACREPAAPATRT